LALFLTGRDIDCPGCGYNLRDLGTEHCPECRHRLVLTVSLADPPAVRFTLAAIALSAWGVAFGLLVVAVLIISALERDAPTGDAAVVLLWSPLVGCVVAAALLLRFLSLRSRRLFASRTKGMQWLTVLRCAFVSLALLGLWVVAIWLLF